MASSEGWYSEHLPRIYSELVLTQLTHLVPVSPSYRNQSIDLLCKWFLYEGNTGT